MINLLYAHCPVSAVTEKAFQYWLPQITPAMQQQVLAYRQKQDAYLCLFGKVLVHKGLQRQGIGGFSLQHVTSVPLQKPFLPHTDIDFNIAHSGEYVVVALSRTATVGIDLEKNQSIELRDFEAQFTPQEWGRLCQASEPQRLFYTYWTQKEAVLKATGKGLSIPMNSFEITSGQVRLGEQVWYIQEVNLVPEYSCHVAASQSEPITIQNMTCEIFIGK